MNSRTIITKLTKNKTQVFTAKKDEHLTLILLATSQADYSAEVKLIGTGSKADILGIVLGKEADSITIHTLQSHESPDTQSNLLIKSILTGRSQFNYEGYIRIKKKAQRSNAYQRNENLMLSGEAKAESKPALEIMANDVRCTHSATMGKVDSELLFYLMSRGLSKNSATKIIVEGFIAPILDKIDNESLKQQLTKQIVI